MRKILLKNKLLLFATIIFAISCFVLGFYIGNVKADSEYLFSYDCAISESYEMGDVVVIPKGKISNGNNEYDASYSVILPDGSASTLSSITVKDIGEYTIEYIAFAQDEGKYYTDTLSFRVKLDKFSVNGEGNFEYKEYSEVKSGVLATMYNGDILEYNDIIDLNDFDYTSQLFKFMFIPQKNGEADIDRLEIVLSDVYDESKFISIRLKKCKETGYVGVVTYVDCSFDGDTYIGINPSNSSGTYKYTDSYSKKENNYYIYENVEQFGTQIQMAWIGGRTTNDGGYSDNWFALYYDQKTTELYAETTYQDTTIVSRYLVAKLDDVSLFAEPFTGFTDGKVKLSFRPYMFNKNSCSLIISEVAGEKLTKENYKDFTYSDGPDILIDYNGYSEKTIPSAAQGESYPIFKASAFDKVDGYVNLKTTVYFGYNSEKPVVIAIDESGKFKSDYCGYYTIEYVAENSLGKRTVSTLNILCTTKTGDLSLKLTGLKESANIGDNVKLFSNFTAENYFGNCNVFATLTLLDNPKIIYNLNADNNYTFKPLYAGEYSLSITLSDYVSEVSYDYSFKVNQANNIFYEVVDGVFSHYILKNGSYNFPTVKGIDLSSGEPQDVATDLYISIDGEQETLVDSSLFKVTGNNNIELIYKPKDLDWATPYSVNLPIINTGLGGYIESYKYFNVLSGTINFTPNDDSVAMEVTQLKDSKVTMEFANILSGEFFKLNILAYKGEETFVPITSFEVVLTDAKNSSNYVTITIFVEDDGVFAKFNNGNPVKVADSWNENSEFLIDYSISNKTLDIAGRTIKALTLFGKEEAPIFADGVFATFSISSKTTGCGIKVASLNSQTINKSKYDRIAPTVDLSLDNNAGEQEINSVIIINPYKAYDVFSPGTETRITITDVNGNIMTSIDGVILNDIVIDRPYSIKLTQYGDYNVSIVTKDIASKKESSIPIQINVIDKVLPNISLGEYEKSAECGKAYTIASVKVDKKGCTTFAVVVDERGTYSFVNGKTYTFKYSGKYTVIISAIDESGNMASVKYTVVVK